MCDTIQVVPCTKHF